MTPPWKALALMILTAAPGLAQDVDCAEAEDQAELTGCAHDGWVRADADLNEAYGAAMALLREVDAGLPESERGAAAALKAAQRAWITFRDQACLAEGYLMHGGSAEPMLIYGCMQGLTEDRAASLWQLAETM